MPNIGEDGEPQECIHYSRNRNWYVHFGKVWHYLQILNTGIICDPAILLTLPNRKLCQKHESECSQHVTSHEPQASCQV